MDIVDRLRWRGDAEAEALETMDAAAAEIERLRTELLEQARIIGMSGERELALRAEIERLRKALEGISEFGEQHPGHGHSCHRRARAALSEKSHD